MKMLALEFSSSQRSVSAANFAAGESVVAEVVETGGRATKALGMVEEALRQAQLEREQIDSVVVGLGPGSYTGIRAAISLAQGWQLAAEVGLIGISSVAAIAAQAWEEGLREKMAVVVDAQRNEFYIAEYELNEAGPIEIRPLRLASMSEAQTLSHNRLVVGPEVERWFAAGRAMVPRASTLARMALKRTDSVPGEQLEPIYLRQPQFVKAPLPRIVP